MRLRCDVPLYDQALTRRLLEPGRASPHFSPPTCYGTVCRALDCVRATNPILNVQEHASGRIGVSSLPGHDLRHLATVSGEKTGLVKVFLEPRDGGR